MTIWQNDSLDFFACQTVQRLDKDQKTCVFLTFNTRWYCIMKWKNLKIRRVVPNVTTFFVQEKETEGTR